MLIKQIGAKYAIVKLDNISWVLQTTSEGNDRKPFCYVDSNHTFHQINNGSNEAGIFLEISETFSKTSVSPSWR